MDEAEATSETTETQPAQERDAFDFSALRGFQLVQAIEGENRASEPRDDWIGALRLELDARAARLGESVDSALVLANDGVIRWLGDPVAKLAQGDSLFAPTALVLADEALTEAGRATVKTRIELWAGAYLRRLLGSLSDLEKLIEGSEVVRDVAGLLARSMGVLEREPIRSKIKALDQEARGELRKRGVRFGAYYIYVPALLKPAARALALHLAGLRASAGPSSALVETLAPLASSGRTSLKADPAISRESYRIAGFRLCGERAVRVDIVERLADMIRAASGPSAAHGGGKISPGFVVTPQMTSLTGCSGEQFASILRSLGYVVAPIRRSEFMESSRPPAGLGEAAAAPAGEAVADASPESPARASPDVAHADAADPRPQAGQSPVEAGGGAVPAEGLPPSQPAPEDETAAAGAAPEGPAVASPDIGHADAANRPPQAGQSPVEAGGAVPAEGLPSSQPAPKDIPASAGAPDAPPAEGARTDKSSAGTAAAQADDEIVVVWRRAPRFQPGPARSRPAGRRPERAGLEAAASQTDAPEAQQTESERTKFRHRRRGAKSDASREAGGRARQKPQQTARQEAESVSGPPPSETPSPRLDHRRSRNEAKPAARERPEQAKPAANLDSPFAKLLELRALLAKQKDKRS
jgi:ATP-dependent RNA helicase SUPV3L1/SUV3